MLVFCLRFVTSKLKLVRCGNSKLCANTFCSRFGVVELGCGSIKLLHLLFVTSLQLCNNQTRVSILWQQQVSTLVFCLASNLCATFFCLGFAAIGLGHGNNKFVHLFFFASLQFYNN